MQPGLLPRCSLEDLTPRVLPLIAWSWRYQFDNCSLSTVQELGAKFWFAVFAAKFLGFFQDNLAVHILEIYQSRHHQLLKLRPDVRRGVGKFLTNRRLLELY